MTPVLRRSGAEIRRYFWYPKRDKYDCWSLEGKSITTDHIVIISHAQGYLLPDSKSESEFKFTYLLRYLELEANIADSCVSARVYFLTQFLLKNIEKRSRNRDFKIGPFGLNMQTKFASWRWRIWHEMCSHRVMSMVSTMCQAIQPLPAYPKMH